MQLIALAILALALNEAPSASPVFLSCEIAYADGTSRAHVDLNLNEPAETAGITIRETGYSVQKMPAVFAPDIVSWSNGSTRYAVNRSSLVLTEMHFGSESEILDARRTGQCALHRASAKRKF